MHARARTRYTCLAPTYCTSSAAQLQRTEHLSTLRTHPENAFVRIDTEAQRLKIMKVMGTRPLHLAGRTVKRGLSLVPLVATPSTRANETRNTPPAGALFVLALVLCSIGHCTCRFIVLYFIIFAAFHSVLAPPWAARILPLYLRTVIIDVLTESNKRHKWARVISLLYELTWLAGAPFFLSRTARDTIFPMRASKGDPPPRYRHVVPMIHVYVYTVRYTRNVTSGEPCRIPRGHSCNLRFGKEYTRVHSNWFI